MPPSVYAVRSSQHTSISFKSSFLPFHRAKYGSEYIGKGFRAAERIQKNIEENISDVKICAVPNIGQQQLYTLRRMYSGISCISLNACYNGADDQEMYLQYIIPSGEDVEEDCIDNISKEQAARELWNEVDQLDGQQAQIIKARYKYRNTRSAAAANIGVSFNEARVLERKAIASLRKRRKLLELAEVFDCLNYRSTGLSAFRLRRMSNVEYVSLKKLKIKEQLKDLE